MRAKDLREGKKALIFSLKTPTARLILKPWEEDEDVLTLKQVHSSEVFLVDDLKSGLEGDALITQRRGLKIGIRTADCVPVALLGKKTVAVVHAGWRGLKEGILEKTVDILKTLEPLDSFLAFVGPSAKACCYEVGDEFRDYFVSLHFRKGRHYMDTQTETVIRLKDSGIRNILLYGICTICHHSLPSHRRNKTKERILTYAELVEG